MVLFGAHGSAFFSGIVLGGLLLCVGLVIGRWLGLRSATRNDSNSLEHQRMLELIRRLVHWTHGMADQMVEYGGVVDNVAKLLGQDYDPTDRGQREATVQAMEEVIRANEELQQRLNHAETMLKQQSSELATYVSEARTDPLTELPNRRAFDEELERRISERHRYGAALSSLMVDIDHFKKVNDAFGHQAGDEVLRGVADVLRDTMRDTDIVARIGGEEIAILLPSSGAEDGNRAAERARKAIEQAVFTYGGRTIRVTASIGGAECLPDETGLSLMERADEALYCAKRSGRNRVVWQDGKRCLPLAAETSLDKTEATTAYGTDPLSEDGADPVFANICADLRQRLESVSEAGSVEN